MVDFFQQQQKAVWDILTQASQVLIRVPDPQESLKHSAGGRTLNNTTQHQRQEGRKRKNPDIFAAATFEPVNRILLEINSNSFRHDFYRLTHHLTVPAARCGITNMSLLQCMGSSVGMTRVQLLLIKDKELKAEMDQY